MLLNGDALEWRSSFAFASYGGQVEEIKRLDALLEQVVMHGDDAGTKGVVICRKRRNVLRIRR